MYLGVERKKMFILGRWGIVFGYRCWILCMHQIEILHIFVLNLREIHLFGKNVFFFFQQNLGPFSVMAAKNTALTVKTAFFVKKKNMVVKGLTEIL